MKRGIILSLDNKKAVVMTADGQFISIPQQSHMRIGEETTIPAETSAPKRKPKQVYWYSGAAAAVLLFFLPFFYLTTAEAHPVVAYVSLDINPSIELGVDKQQRVQELKGLNGDGQAIVSKLDYKGKPLETVAASIMSTVASEHYLDKPDKDIVITSLALNNADDLEQTVAGAVDQKVKDTIKQIDSTKEANVTVLSVPTEVRDEAKANGISSGKMAVYLMAKDEGYEIELEQLKAQSIAEVTEKAGGVKKIVEQGASKEKLKELVAKEKKSKKQATATPAADKTATATATTVPNKNAVKANPAKETNPPRPLRPSPSEKPIWSKDRNQSANKPNRPVKPISPTKPSGKDDDKKRNGDWSNNRNDRWSNSESDDDNGKKNNSGKNNSSKNANKLESWTWKTERDNERNHDRGNSNRNKWESNRNH
ncbi:anti-sigma factor domain-containing protein [Paenibacillus glycanilyticus]|uniref:RsgI N-terminal anti-sigma domain-containing protein n=1 Tax=Paenibacillus glycanilyticus TaxID=126569 RepID=A0ABQ6GBI7_9BACL|nr:anti-sigma factor domain-containing protein [Paenibacillus glycanilyticus]GLX67610.1 hypothetical protein MU1_19550 [Paenibacillus glycanilyticus]